MKISAVAVSSAVLLSCVGCSDGSDASSESSQTPVSSTTTSSIASTTTTEPEVVVPYDLSTFELVGNDGWVYLVTPEVDGLVEVTSVEKTVADSPPGQARAALEISVPNIFASAVSADPERNPPEIGFDRVNLWFPLQSSELGLFHGQENFGELECELGGGPSPTASELGMPDREERRAMLSCFGVEPSGTYQILFEDDEATVDGVVSEFGADPPIIQILARWNTGVPCSIFLAPEGRTVTNSIMTDVPC